MASQTPYRYLNCMRCLEFKPLKVAGKCMHSFCTKCLSAVFQSRNADCTAFLCPVCQEDCLLPLNGVKGLVDFTREDVGGFITFADLEPVPKQEQLTPGRKNKKKKKKFKDVNTENVFIAKCQICRHNRKDVPAANLCLECDELYICKKCTAVHAGNKATKNHKVMSLQSSETERNGAAVCQGHHAPLKKYCLTCGKAVCKICVNLDHGNYMIEQLNNTIDKNVAATKVLLKERKEEFTKLVQAQTELTELHAVAQKVDLRDALVKEIEDHAQKCMDQITTWKEDLKKQATADFEVVQDIPECLATVTEMVKERTETMDRAARLLKTGRIGHDPAYLQQLIVLQHDLEAARTFKELEVEDLRYDLQTLKDKLSDDECTTYRYVSLEKGGPIKPWRDGLQTHGDKHEQKAAEYIQLFLQGICGYKETFNVNIHAPMSELMQVYFDRTGKPADWDPSNPGVTGPRLIWSGKQLWDTDTVQMIGIKNYDTIHVVYKLRGS